jgi:hypothetical protein
VFVEGGAGEGLGEDTFEALAVAFDGVDQLADRWLLGVALKMRPAGFLKVVAHNGLAPTRRSGEKLAWPEPCLRGLCAQAEPRRRFRREAGGLPEFGFEADGCAVGFGWLFDGWDQSYKRLASARR